MRTDGICGAPVAVRISSPFCSAADPVTGLCTACKFGNEPVDGKCCGKGKVISGGNCVKVAGGIIPLP